MKNNFLGIEQLEVYLERDIGRILSWLEQMFDVTYSTDTHLTRTKQFKQLGEKMLKSDPLLKAWFAKEQLFKSAEKIATLEATAASDADKIATLEATVASDADKIATFEATVASLKANNQKDDQDNSDGVCIITDDGGSTALPIEPNAKRPKN
jgi:uncharacterized coiled-coil protein SlyX